MTETTTTPQPAGSELEALAAQLVSDAQKLRDRIPDFAMPHASRPKLSGIAAVVPQAAVDGCFNACKVDEGLAKSIDLESTHFDAHYFTVFSELRDELKRIYLGLDYTIRAKRFNVGQATLRVLNFARRMSKSPDKAYLTPYIQEMEKATVRRRNGKKAEPAPEPVPAP